MGLLETIRGKTLKARTNNEMKRILLGEAAKRQHERRLSDSREYAKTVVFPRIVKEIHAAAAEGVHTLNHQLIQRGRDWDSVYDVEVSQEAVRLLKVEGFDVQYHLGAPQQLYVDW